MKKHRTKKQTVVVVAIMVSVVLIWQRQWLINENVSTEDSQDDISGIFLPKHRITDNYPRITAKYHHKLTSRPTHSDEKNYHMQQQNFFQTGRSDSNNFSETSKEYRQLEAEFSKAKFSINREAEILEEKTNEAEELLKLQVVNDKTTLVVAESLPKVEEEFQVKNDDSNERNLINFMSQNNFRRHEVDVKNESQLFRNIKNEFKTAGKNMQKNSNLPSKPPENVLSDMNDNEINDSRQKFFGKMPSFEDYDLPVLNVSVSKPGNEILPLLPTGFVMEKSKEGAGQEVDSTMEGVIILGKVNNTKNYAVFSTTTEDRNALSYIFYIPLTVLAWKRIGFDSVVIIVGKKDEWDADPLLYHVLTTAQQLDCIVVFLEPRSEKSIMISQVGRLFAANILQSTFQGIDDVYLITSDADLWPIYGDVYVLPSGKKILSINSDCCNPFKHRGTTYRMLPMANVGTTVGNWRELTRKFGESPKTIDDILTYFVQEFGPVALRPVHKGDNVGWFLDQMMVSILIAKWINEHGSTEVKFVPRDVGVDRIDRAGWSYGQNGIEDKIDAHLLLEAYIPGNWVRITHLLRAMYGDMTERYLWCVNYYENFQRLFLEKYRNRRS